MNLTEGLEEYIIIKLINQNAYDVNFKVSITTNMEKIKKLYAQCQALSADSLRFLFNGRRINGDITPWNLDMKDGDVIEVLVDKSHELTADGYLFIKLLGVSGEVRLFKIKQSMNLSRLKKHYSECVNVAEIFLRFKFKGRTVNDESTPWSLKMKEDDEIVVSFEALNSKLKHVSIRVLFPDNEMFRNQEKLFKIKSSTSIGRLVKYYTDKNQIPDQSLGFMFKGLQIKSDDTPEQLKMKDDDVIEVFCKETEENNEIKYTRIKAMYRDSVWRFKVRPRTKLKKLKKAFSELANMHATHLHFMFMGKLIRDDDTPERLNMSDDIFIEVFQDRSAPKASLDH